MDRNRLIIQGLITSNLLAKALKIINCFFCDFEIYYRMELWDLNSRLMLEEQK